MPNNESDVAKIYAELNEEGLSPEGLRFSLGVNTFPAVTAMVADTSGKVVKKPVSSQVLDRIGGYQSRRLAGRNEPDFFVTAEDGIGNSMDYEGFTAAPVLDLTKVSTSDKITTVGYDAFLDALDLSIYDASVSADRPETTFLKPVPAAKDGDLPGVLQQVTDALVKNYEASLEMQTTDIAKERITIQHEINESGPLGLWKQILFSSDVTFLRWEDAFKQAPGLGTVLTEKVKEILMAGSPGFWNKVRSIMSAFQLYYVPDFNGPGYFVRMDEKVGEPSGTIDASVTGLTVADGSPKILQPGGVVMETGSTMINPGGLRLESLADLLEERVVGYYPKPLQSGYIHQVEPPFWLMDNGHLSLFDTNAENLTTSDVEVATVDFSLDARKKRVQEADEFLAELVATSQSILEEYCEIIFKDIQLAHSTASLTLPLNFSTNDHIGKRVTVNILGDGGGSFTAFVTGVDHGVDLVKGKSINTYTKVQLSHCDYS